MNNFKRRAAAVASAFVFAAVAVLWPSAALAGERSVDDQIEQVLRDFPGGVRTAHNEVSWDGGSVVLTILDGASARAVGSCATGKFCAYSATGLGGSKLTFSSCSGTNSTASLGAVRSIANARSSGTVYAFNGSTSVASATAGSSSDVWSTVTRLGC